MHTRLRQDEIARLQPGREATCEPEAHQRRGALGQEALCLRRRPLGAAAAERDGDVLPAQAAGLGAKAGDRRDRDACLLSAHIPQATRRSFLAIRF